MDWDLLEKTTFWIEDIDLKNADLTKIASVTAQTLGLLSSEVMVVDVRPGLVAFDILKRYINAESVIGKEKEILDNISKISNVTLGPHASVHSEGILGLIALDSEEAHKVLDRSKTMAQNISDVIALRALVFASGAEVIAENIKDTNSPYIIEKLKANGYRAEFGGILEDDLITTVNKLEDALERGYGLIITTGGVGAEDKDINVEAILKLDPNASTPWILKFQPDYHRHYKEGVRIGVGKIGTTYLVALPGPHEEAKLGFDKLMEGIKNGLDQYKLADYIASALRNRWQNAMKEIK